jgi:hypothetical protein
MNKKIEISNTILFFIVFPSLFFPKIGLIDLSLIGLFIGIFYLIIHRRNIFINKYLFKLTLFLLFILCYSLIILLFNSEQDDAFFSVLRIARSLILFLFFSILFSNVHIEEKSFLKVILFILAINSLFIILEVVNINFQMVMAGIVGYNKPPFPFRGFGLTAGFEIAGLLSLTGLLLVYTLIYFDKKITIINTLYLILFFISVVFTSRTFIVLSALLNFAALLFFVINGSFKLKFFATTILFLFTTLFVAYALPLLIATLNAFGYGFTDVNLNDFSDSYNIHQTNVYSDLLIYPDTTIKSIFFGNSNSPISDYGYLMMWHMNGIIGLLLVFLFFVYLNWKLPNKISFVPLKIIFYFYFILLLLINIKILIVLGRISNDLLWIFVAYILSKKNILDGYKTIVPRNTKETAYD